MPAKLPRQKTGLIAATALAIVLVLLPLIGAPESWLLYVFLFSIYLAMANM